MIPLTSGSTPLIFMQLSCQIIHRAQAFNHKPNPRQLYMSLYRAQGKPGINKKNRIHANCRRAESYPMIPGLSLNIEKSALEIITSLRPSPGPVPFYRRFAERPELLEGR